MRLSAVRARVRDKTLDPKADGQAGQRKTDAEIDRYINTEIQSLARRRADADSSYGLVHFKIAGDNAARVVQVTDTTFRYLLPSWVHRVAHVREDLEAEGRRGRPIPPTYFERDASCAWYWEKDDALILRNSEALDLILSVQRIPTMLHAGTCRADGSAADRIPLDLETNIGDVFDPEDGAYLGARIEIVGGQDTAGGTRDPRGRVCTVVDQARAWNGALAGFVTELTVQPAPAATVAADDTYEFHIPLQDSEVSYLVLLVAEQIWQESKNVHALNSIRSKLEEEERLFIDGIQPRQHMQPHVQSDGILPIGFDDDRDLIWLAGNI